jgi:anti-anti-sigma regulatory factor
MRSEAPDFTIESRGRWIWIFVSGPFHAQQIPGMKEKIGVLIEDGNRQLVLDLQNVTEVDDTVPQMFLSLVNIVREKGGEARFIFKNDAVSKAFAPYKSLFSIYPDAQSLPSGGPFSRVRRLSRVLTKKTGLRLSFPIALTLLCALAGWILSLVFIIHLQHVRIRQQESDIRELSEFKRQTSGEIKTLRERIRPLEQLGILRDSTAHRSHE